MKTLNSIFVNDRVLEVVWCVFFLCGFLTNFPRTAIVINSFIVLLFVVSFFVRRPSRMTTTTFFLIVITAISSLNNVFICNDFLSSEKAPCILPILCMMALTAEWMYVPGIYEKIQVYNCLPLILLFALGGFHFNYFGRISTDYISATTKDIFYLTGYCATLYLILSNKINRLLGLAVLAACLTMIVVSGSRKDFLFVILSIVFLYPLLVRSFKRYNALIRVLLFSIVFAVGVFFVIQLVHAQLQRFGADSIVEIIGATDEEASALEREDYIRTGFSVATHYPLGVGEQNIINALKQYGGSYWKETYNVHSLLAQVLFDGGYVGLLLLIILTIKYIKISLVDLRKFYAMPLFFLLMIFTGPMFLTRFLWPLLVFYEKEALYFKQG